MQKVIDRIEVLTQGLNKATMKGLEIGPWHAPLTPKKAGWKTTVVDYTDATTLRKFAASNPDMADMISNIEEVDIIWGGGLPERASHPAQCNQLRLRCFQP